MYSTHGYRAIQTYTCWCSNTYTSEGRWLLIDRVVYCKFCNSGFISVDIVNVCSLLHLSRLVIFHIYGWNFEKQVPTHALHNIVKWKSVNGWAFYKTIYYVAVFASIQQKWVYYIDMETSEYIQNYSS